MLTARRNTLGEIQQMLRDKQETIQVAAAITASLRSANPSIRVAHSIYEVEERENRRGGGGAISVVAPSDIESDFDDEVVSGRVYRRVLAQARATVNNTGSDRREAGLGRIEEVAAASADRNPPSVSPRRVPVSRRRDRQLIGDRPAPSRQRRDQHLDAADQLADDLSETLTVVEKPSPPPPRSRASPQPFRLEPRPLPEALITRPSSPPGVPPPPHALTTRLSLRPEPPALPRPGGASHPRRGLLPPAAKRKTKAEIWRPKGTSKPAANQTTVTALKAEYLEPTRQSRLSFAWGSKSKRCERLECCKPLAAGRGTEAPHLVVQVAEGRQFHEECFRCWLVCLFPLAWLSSLGRY